MENIIEPDASYEFSQLMCISPSSLGGGNYFIRLLQKSGQRPFYIQPPKCITKQGIQKSGKKMYSDLLFRHEDEPFNEFLESLETFCKKQLFHMREKWFDSSLTEETIEDSFTPIIKLYKSGKYHSVRVQIPTRLGKCSLKIFDEDENEVALEQIRENTSILTILEIQGIRCTARSFQLDMEVKQMMLLKPVDLFETCLFSKKTPVAKKEVVAVAAPSLVINTPPTVEPTEESLDDQVEEENTVAMDPTIPSSTVNDTTVEIVDVESDSDHENEKMNSTEDGDGDNDKNGGEGEGDNVDNNERSEDVEIELNNDSGMNREDEENGENDLPPPITLARTVLDSGIDEVDLDIPVDDNSITLRKRNDVYFEMYKEAKRKARIARDLAITSYLEAKKIRHTYLDPDAFSDDEKEEGILEKEMDSLKSMNSENV